MSTCLIISQGEKMYIGADTACSVKTQNGYQRFSNNMQKLFTIGNNIFFCSGKKQDVDKSVNWIYDSFNDSIDVIELEQYLKDNFSTINQDNIFNIEFLLCDYSTYCVTQLSQYNNFKPVKYEKSNQLRIICGGYKTKDSFFIAKDNILSRIPIKNVYNNVFDNIADECVGGNVILYDSPIHFEKISVNEKNIKYANSDNLFLLTSDFVTAGYIYGSQIISGDIYSENYKLDSEGSVIQGSHLSLKDGSFSFGGSSLRYDPINGLFVNGNITSGSTITGSKIIGGSIEIGKNFTVDEEGNVVGVNSHFTNGTFTGTITTDNLTATGGIIGGWYIIDGVLYDYDGTINTMGAGMQSGQYDYSSEIQNADISFWAGAPFKNRYLAPFLVKVDGSVTANSLTTNNITATGGVIGGCTIKDGVLQIGNVNIGEKLTADSIDATNLKVTAANVTGTLTASQIDATDLKVSAANVTGQLTASQINTTGLIAENISGTTITGKTISGGQINIGNGVFTVSTTGAMKCTSATITGTVTSSNLTATGGSIGGWSIGTNSLTAGTSGSTSFIGLYSSYATDENYRIVVGNKAFTVRRDGYITATSGKIGGWNIGTYQGYTGIYSNQADDGNGVQSTIMLSASKGIGLYTSSGWDWTSWQKIIAV